MKREIEMQHFETKAASEEGEEEEEKRRRWKGEGGGRCSRGYPPAEGGVEHSQRDGSQENDIVFSLQTERRRRRRSKQTEGGGGEKGGEAETFFRQTAVRKTGRRRRCQDVGQED